MQPNNTPGKNASDIGLIIDAMDILYTGDVQGFCIVSSDGDFNKLATRLREAGKFVIGMGEKKTPESFRVSCERFIFLDVIESEVPGAGRMSEDSGSQGADAAPQSAAQETSAGRSASSQTTVRRRRAAVVSEAAPSYKSVTSGSQKTSSVEEVEPEQDYDTDSEALFTDKATIGRDRLPPGQNIPRFRRPQLPLQQALRVSQGFLIAQGREPRQRGVGLPQQFSGQRDRAADPADLQAARNGRHVYDHPQEGASRGLPAPDDRLRRGQRKTCASEEERLTGY